MMKARFSSSQSWTESLIYDGKLYRYSEGRVNKTWKEGFASLRDDSSFRWYKDPQYLERKCELWIDEIASQMRFGRGATAAYGAPPKMKMKRMPGGSSAYEDLLMAFPFTKPGQKQSHIQWFLFTSETQKKFWMNAFSQALEGVACLPPTAQSAGYLHAQSAPTYRRAKSESYMNENSQSTWERYWIGYCSHKSTTDRARDTNQNQTPRAASDREIGPNQGSPPSYTSQDTARVEGSSGFDGRGSAAASHDDYDEKHTHSDGETTALTDSYPLVRHPTSPPQGTRTEEFGRTPVVSPDESLDVDTTLNDDSPNPSPAVPRVSA